MAIVYVKPNENSYITAVDSSAFLSDVTGWVEIDRGTGDRFHHAQNNYFEKPVKTDGGACRYKLINKTPVECSAEEIRKQEEANTHKPTAPRNIMVDEYITVDGVLYKATANIPNGAYIITGQNAVVTTVEEQLYEMMKGE